MRKRKRNGRIKAFLPVMIGLAVIAMVAKSFLPDFVRYMRIRQM